MNLLRESGARWYRFDLAWNTFQYKNRDIKTNNFSWNSFDYVINSLPSGIKILGILGFNVEASPDPNLVDQPAKACHSMPDLTPVVQIPEINRTVSYWENYVYKVVSRYGANANNLGSGFGQNKIKYWEVWNEEDQNFWTATCDDAAAPAPNASDYARLLKATYQIIKLADPSATVLLGGIADYDPNGNNISGRVHTKTKNYISTLYNTDADGDGVTEKFNYFDIFAIHPYVSIPSRTNPQAMTLFLNDLVDFLKSIDNSYNKPIWISEVGVSYCNQDQNSLNEEAEALRRTYEQALSHPSNLIKKVFWYKLVPNSKITTAPDDICLTMAQCDDNIPQTSDPESQRCQSWVKEPSFQKYKELAWEKYNYKREDNSPNASVDLLPSAPSWYWENNDRQITWGSIDYPELGIAAYREGKYEDGHDYTGNILLTGPKIASDGLIKATADIEVPDSNIVLLTGRIAFGYDQSQTNGVRVGIYIRDPNNNTFPPLYQETINYTSSVKNFSINLTPYRGLRMPLIIIVFANGNPAYDNLGWLSLNMEYYDPVLPQATPAPVSIAAVEGQPFSPSGQTDCLRNLAASCLPNSQARLLWESTSSPTSFQIQTCNRGVDGKQPCANNDTYATENSTLDIPIACNNYYDWWVTVLPEQCTIQGPSNVFCPCQSTNLQKETIKRKEPSFSR